MGFIERLKAQKAEQEELQRQRNLRFHEEMRVQSEARRAEGQRLKAMEEQAERYFQKSGLGEMLAEVAELTGSHVNYSGGDQGICRKRLEISRREPDFDEYGEHKFIDIKTDAEGTIRFDAGIRGSSTISQAHWQQDKDVLEKALGKAYNNPRIEEYRHPSASEAGVGPGS